MPISGATVAPDATTYAAPTGGADLTLSSVSTSGVDKVKAFYTSETDFLTRTEYEFSVKYPAVLSTAPGGWTQARQTVFMKKPRTLANGNRTVDTCSITFAHDPETTTADRLAMRLELVQLLGNTTFGSFWKTNNLS